MMAIIFRKKTTPIIVIKMLSFVARFIFYMLLSENGNKLPIRT